MIHTLLFMTRDQVVVEKDETSFKLFLPMNENDQISLKRIAHSADYFGLGLALSL